LLGAAGYAGRGADAWLLFPAAGVGFLDPLAVVAVRLRDLGESGDAAWRDVADQAVWSAFNAGLVGSYAGGLVYAELGIRAVCAAVAVVAASVETNHWFGSTQATLKLV